MMTGTDDEPLLGAADDPAEPHQSQIDQQHRERETAALEENQDNAWKSFRRHVTVEPIAFLYFIAFVSGSSASSQFIYHIISEQHGYSPSGGNISNCSRDAPKQSDIGKLVQEETSRYNLLSDLVTLIPSAIATLMMGHFSDTRGRKIPLIAPLVGYSLKSAFMVFAAKYKINIYYILLASALESFTGGLISVLMAMFAYIADVTRKDNRSHRIYIVELTICVAISVAEISTGYLISSYGFLPSFLYSTAASFLSLVLAVFYLPETVVRQQRRPSNSLCSFYSLVTTLRLYLWASGDRRPKLILMLFIILLSLFGGGSNSITSTFLLGYPNCFDPILLGYYQAAAYIVRAVAGLLIMLSLKKKCSDTTFIMIGLSSSILANMAWGFAVNRIIVFLTPVIGCASLLTIPLCRSQSSKLVAPHQQGALFAAIALAETLTGYVGGIVTNLVYIHSLPIYFGIVFFYGAGVGLVSLILAIALHIISKRAAPLSINADNVNDAVSDNPVS